jgi:SAM-dependent methyltransferase
MRRPEFIARQSRRPEGWFGRLLATLMAWETSKENDTAIALLEIQPGDRVLEVGFGHGRSIASAAARTRGGLVAGLDLSPTMVAMANRRNRALAERGLADLRHGDSLHLPFEDAAFDKAFSVNTVYFWTSPVEHMREIWRVLTKGGIFVLGFRPDKDGIGRNFPNSVYTFRTAEQIRQMTLSAGFQRVTLIDGGGSGRGVVMAVAVKS